MEYTEAFYVLTQYKKIPAEWIHVHTLPSISLYVIRYYWWDVLKESESLCSNCLKLSSSLISARLDNKNLKLYLLRKYSDGRTTRTLLGQGIYLDYGIIPHQFLDMFGNRTEILLAKNIDGERFNLI